VIAAELSAKCRLAWPIAPLKLLLLLRLVKCWPTAHMAEEPSVAASELCERLSVCNREPSAGDSASCAASLLAHGLVRRPAQLLPVRLLVLLAVLLLTYLAKRSRALGERLGLSVVVLSSSACV
jgi:hypothetical protein